MNTQSQLKFSTMFAAIVISCAATAFGVEFISLGTLGLYTNDVRYNESYPYAISADGLTVVGISFAFAGYDPREAFAWTPEDGMVGLGMREGDVVSYAYDVSSNSSLIVGASYSDFNDAEAVAWNWSGEVFGLGALDEGQDSIARSVSSDGNVIAGISGRLYAGTKIHAFRWENGVGMMDLGFPLAEDTYCIPNGVSPDGSVIVGESGNTGYPAGEPRISAFRWDAEVGMTALATLPDGTGFCSARAVSADGNVIVGWSSPSDNPEESEAVFWTETGDIQSLGDLPGGIIDSAANGVSADGSVIVGYGNFTTNKNKRTALIWDARHGMRTISSILVDAGYDLTGFEFLEATDVSADGKVVVGAVAYPHDVPYPRTLFLAEAFVLYLDDYEPIIISANASPSVLWPPNKKMVSVKVDVVIDDDSEIVEWAIIGVDCSEEFKADDIDIVDDHQVRLRATRSNPHHQRIYTLWLEAIDDAGNHSELYPLEIRVPRNRGKNNKR